MYEDLRLAEYLCTRLCHDLAGPVGAISNGAEFLSDQEGGMMQDAITLIGSSAQEAVIRLQFFRQAYGALNDHGEVNLQDKKKLVLSFFAATKIKVDWPEQSTDASGVSISQKMGRLLLNQILIASRNLIRGGLIGIRIHREADGMRVMRVTATGDGMKEDEDATTILEGDTSLALSARTAQAYLTSRLAQEMRITLSVERQEGSYAVIARRAAAEE